MRALERVAPPGRLAVVAARANELAADPRATLQGVDACGDRVAAEVREAVAAHGGRLQRISVVGHSMGGLVARHAVGRLYDPATRTVAGLRPCHFITMATPHLGCAGESGEAQVPLVRWVRLPGRLAPVVDAVAAAALGRTGEQFFLKDGGGADGQMPLLVRLARDEPDAPFLSALAAFASRTAYANSGGDHLVGWANSSLRRVDQLPDLSHTRGKGVVRDDGPAAGFHPDDAAGRRPVAPTPAPPPSLADASPAAARVAMLEALQALPWRRVDVCFRGTRTPFLAHNLLQVTRGWLNREGEAAAAHVASTLVELDALERGEGGVEDG